MMTQVKNLSVLAVFSLGLAACSNNGGDVHLQPGPTPTPPNSGPGPVQYTQIERLSRPVIKEVFEPFQDHQKSNVAEPYADATIQGDIVATENALRPPTGTTNFGTALATVLYPDEYTVNLAGTAPTAATLGESFLSNELTNGAAFGGRAPNDNVIDLELAALFGNALVKVPVPGLGEDNEENNCLSSQNITGGLPAGKQSTGAFPYLPGPA